MKPNPETNLSIICPVCHQANPVGTEFCKHCWGASLRSVSPVSSQEARKFSKRRLFRVKIRKVLKVAAISLIFLSVVYTGLYYFSDILSRPRQDLSSNSLPGDWAMFRHDQGRSGSTDSSSTLPQGEVKWTFSADAPIHSSPAVVGDTVYIGAQDSKLYALDVATGAKRWEYETESWVESSPAVVDGVVYFGSNDGRLYALDADSGERLWDFDAHYAIKSSPAVADGMVYFGTGDYFVYALDAETGEKLWDFEAEGRVDSSPVVANGIIYIGSGGEFSYALNARTGRFRLRFKAYSSVFSSPVVNDETVYFINFNGSLFAVDGSAQTWLQEHEIKPYWIQLWAFGLPLPTPPPQSGLLWKLKLDEPITSSATIADDILYIGTNNKLVTVDLQRQQMLWEFETRGLISSSPALIGTTVYVGSEDGKLYAVDTATGEKLWDIITGGKITSSPAVADGTVYIGSYDGNLYAIE